MKLIMFDFDGVIADSLHYIRQIMNKLAEKHSFRTVDTDEQFSDLMNNNLLEQIEMLEIPKHLLPLIYIEYKNMMKREHDKIKMFDGIKGVITKLSIDHTLAIVSSNHKDLIDYFLESRGLKDRFKVVMGSEFSYHKNHKIHHLMKELRPKKAFFVTDTVGDIKDAQGIENLTTIGVRWGYHTWSDKDEVKPDILVSDPEELLEKISD